MRTTCGHDHPSWHYLRVSFWIWTRIGTNVGTIVEVGTIAAYLHYQTLNTISAYPSLSKSNLDNKIKVGTIIEVGTISAYLSLYNKKLDHICKVDVLRSGIGPISSIVGFVGNEFGPTLNKLGTIESGFGTNFNKVDTIGYPN